MRNGRADDAAGNRADRAHEREGERERERERARERARDGFESETASSNRRKLFKIAGARNVFAGLGAFRV